MNDKICMRQIYEEVKPCQNEEEYPVIHTRNNNWIITPIKTTPTMMRIRMIMTTMPINSIPTTTNTKVTTKTISKGIIL